MSYLNTVEKIGLVCLVAFIALCIVGSIITANTSIICANHSWPSSSTQLNFDRYCVREINETEYICPLEDVINNSCVLEYENE